MGNTVLGFQIKIHRERASDAKIKEHLKSANVLIIDARMKSAFNNGTVQGAVNAVGDSYQEWAQLGEDAPASVKKLKEEGTLPADTSTPIVVFGDTSCCWAVGAQAECIKEELAKLGYTNFLNVGPKAKVEKLLKD